MSSAEVPQSKFFLFLPPFLTPTSRRGEYSIIKKISHNLSGVATNNTDLEVESEGRFLLYVILLYLYRRNGYYPFLIEFCDVVRCSREISSSKKNHSLLVSVNLEEKMNETNFPQFCLLMEEVMKKSSFWNKGESSHGDLTSIEHMVVIYDDSEEFSKRISSIVRNERRIFVIGVKEDGSEVIFTGNRELQEEDQGTEDCINKVFGHLQVMIKSIEQNHQIPVSQLHTITKEEYNFQFKDLVLNNKNEELLKKSFTTVSAELEKSTELYGDSIAIEISGKTMTYTELNRKVNRISHYLRDVVGVKKGDYVCQVIENSIDCTVYFFAICKLGCVFFAQDHTYPRERKKHIFKETNCETVILNQKFTQYYRQFVPSGCIKNIIEIETIESLLDQYSDDNINVKIDPTDLLYILFSSGTTGEPKGVTGEHCQMFRYLFSNLYHLQTIHSVDMSNYMLFHKPVFVSVFLDMLLPILTGGIQRIIPQSIRYDTMKFIEYITERKMKYIDIPPSVLRLFPKNPSLVPYLTHVTFGGEAMDEVTKSFWGDQNDLMIANSFGMTETTGTHLHFLKKGQSPCHLGKSMINFYTYVLDQFQQPVPIGSTGEIYFGCFGLNEEKEEDEEEEEEKKILRTTISMTRGYINNEKWTNEVYVKDKFNPHLNTRLIKSGDLGRMYKSGEIIYMGRKCFDVRIKGIRIQLNRIEETLKHHKIIEECVIIPYENINQKKVSKRDNKLRTDNIKILAFVIIKKEISDIRLFFNEYLKQQKVMDIALPKEYIIMKKFPLNFAGKINWKKMILFYEEQQKKESTEKNRSKNKSTIHDLDLQIRKLVSKYMKMINEQNKKKEEELKYSNDDDDDFVKKQQEKARRRNRNKELAKKKSKFLKDIRMKKNEKIDVRKVLRKFKRMCEEIVGVKDKENEEEEEEVEGEDDDV